MRMLSEQKKFSIGYSKTDMSRKVHRFFQRLNSENLTYYWSNFSHELKKWEKELTETGISEFILGFCWKQTEADKLNKLLFTSNLIYLVSLLANCSHINVSGNNVLYYTVLYCTVLHCTVLYCTVLYCTVLTAPLIDAASETRNKLRVSLSTQLR
jgi:hypothetical protein